jgi:hypothetical protein
LTTQEVNTLVASIGLPYAYYEFQTGKEQSPPFICFLYDEAEDFYADGINYAAVDTLVIEHYADAPDLRTDRRIGRILNGAGLTHRRTPPVYIKEERMWVTVFRAEICIDNDDEEEGE